jgi:hypothetical protein
MRYKAEAFAPAGAANCRLTGQSFPIFVGRDRKALVKCHQIWKRINWKRKALHCHTLGYEAGCWSFCPASPAFGRKDRDESSHRVLGQPEMEETRFPLARIPPFGRGFLRHRGLPIRYIFASSGESVGNSCVGSERSAHVVGEMMLAKNRRFIGWAVKHGPHCCIRRRNKHCPRHQQLRCPDWTWPHRSRVRHHPNSPAYHSLRWS